MFLIVKKNKKEVAKWIADYITRRINTTVCDGKRQFVLGLPTGSSPVPVYQQLIKLHKQDQLSFKNVVTFNMDEYIGIPTWHPESYQSFMRDKLFKHVDLKPENINLLDGDSEDTHLECCNYEERIKNAGGIDLFLAGLGPDGHVAFNEPASSLSSRTRTVNLAFETIVANSRFFNNDIDSVPKKALTVGVRTIMDSKEVVVIVTGHSKAFALYKVIEEGINHMWTGSMLQMHPRCIFVCDEDATMELKVRTIKYFEGVENDLKLPLACPCELS